MPEAQTNQINVSELLLLWGHMNVKLKVNHQWIRQPAEPVLGF